MALAVVALVAAAPAAMAAEVASGTAILALSDGELAGRLLDAPPAVEGARSTILWQSPHFPMPFEFPLHRVERIRFPQREGTARDAPGPWTIHLFGGDQVVGTLVGIDDRHVLVDADGTGPGGRMAIARGAVRGISRSGADTTFEWNGDPAAWNLSAPGDWARLDAGMVNRRPGARAWRLLPAEPQRLRIDLDLEVRSAATAPTAPGPVDPPRPAAARPGMRRGQQARARGATPPEPMVRVTLGDTPRPPANDAPVVHQGRDAGGQTEAPYGLLLGRFGMVLVRDEATSDGAGRADLQRAGDLPGGRLALSLFVDRAAGRAALVRPGDGEILADVSVEPVPGRPVTALVIEAALGTVVVHGLRVGPWRGAELDVDTSRGGRVSVRGGDSRAGAVVGLADGMLSIDPASGGADGTSGPIALEMVEAIEFPLEPPPAGEVRGTLRVADMAGTTLTGSLTRIAEGAAWVRHAAIDVEVRLPLDNLTTFMGVRGDAAAPPAGRSGRMTLDGLTMTGCLESTGPADAGGIGVGWRPSGSLLASPVPLGAEAPRARIVYDDLRQGDAPAEAIGWLGIEVDDVDGALVTGLNPGSPANGFVRPGMRILAIAPIQGKPFVDTEGLSSEEVVMLLEGPVGDTVRLRLEAPGEMPGQTSCARVPRTDGRPRRSLEELAAFHERLIAGAAPPPPDPDAAESRLILVSGESVGCRVESIDERGLSIVVDGNAAVTIPAAAVQAVELLPSSRRRISVEKFRSLVTVPRSQRSSPPTHLVRSPRGDYLRGRIVSLDGQSLRIAVDAQPRAKPTVIPRSEVARVIWLHPELLADDWQPLPEDPAAGLPVEGVWPDGSRRRLAATAIDDGMLVGTHPLLGPSRIDLGTVERLVIGGGLEDSPRARPYAQWTLRPASEPRREPPR